MSKIIKHTFEVPNLVIQDGELVEGKPTKVTCTFTLLFKGFGLFEEIHGSTLFSAMLENVKDNENDVENAKGLFGSSFIKDLASASYVKIEGNKFHNNRATVEEFKRSQVFPFIENDVEFITKLSQMASDCIYDEQRNRVLNEKEATRPKK